MQGNLQDVARVGLVHHLLYPDCAVDPDFHVTSLETFLTTFDPPVFDCVLPYGEARRRRLIEFINRRPRSLAYAIHFFPLRKFSLGSTDVQEQAMTRLILEDQIDMARAVHATAMIIASGADPGAADRDAAKTAFRDFCIWLCDKLKPLGMKALLEPFDRTFDKRFLFGPTRECVDLITSLRGQIDNLGIELDMAHVPLMGEDLVAAIHTVAPYLERVHLGNCVRRDPADPFYGDTHPPVGYPGGEIDVPELTLILRALLDIGYLNADAPGDLLLEMQPPPGSSAQETVADAMGRLNEAWTRA